MVKFHVSFHLKLKPLIQKVRRRFSGTVKAARPELDPAAGYARWAATYDDPSPNLMLELEGEAFAGLLARVDLKDKFIIDVGCGTGRHWGRMLVGKPGRLKGYDVSPEMLSRLRRKYPKAEVSVISSKSCALPDVAPASANVIISNLVLAHVENLEPMFEEWNRVLKPGGDILLTDYHPGALASGADRTFRHDGQTIAIRNFIHPIAEVREMFGCMGWREIEFCELKVEPKHKRFYEARDALSVYERFLDTPIVYGWGLKKA
jgi:ubiquinone/menaquinone biosynthesis C-methylase UbiE